MDQITDVQCSAETETLMTLSRLFTYPELLPDGRDLARIFPQAGPVPACPSLTGLQNRYVSLFINRLPEVPCIPCGSWYLEGTLMGPSTMKLAGLYREYGFETTEMPDHICVELEFLAILSTLVHQAPGDDYKDQVTTDLNFVTNHLAAWTPDFFGRVASWDTDGFYGDLAGMCQMISSTTGLWPLQTAAVPGYRTGL
ncbi:MAG: molecular chaperone TorD family protein [Desulfotignum sp.]|nr:molecular chaperone TorD family protein [Desulfotignum sp.]MCF8092496.1 molecular chaperone TorD family protein [Desulfotignum sp.]MCF8135996.1 molecular chaperone TorD family protein [Desulfotignum sp.]